jgi:hypothetical protein
MKRVKTKGEKNMEDNRSFTPEQETLEILETAPAAEAQPAAEVFPDEEEEQTSFGRTRSNKWFLIGGAMVIFLAAAVFFGARLLKPPSANGAAFGNGEMMLSSKGGPAGGKSVSIQMEPAKEMPQDKPTTNGLFVRREDQSIFIGTGNVRIMARKGPGDSDSSSSVTGNYDGPVVEVVINHQTQIYQDITEMMPPDSADGDEVKVQQKVKPGSLDDLGENSMVTVWGEKQGDRYIAKVIAFR